MATFDGGIYVPHKRKSDSKVNCMFAMNMRKDNLDYVEWVASVLSNITSCRITDRKDYNTDGCARAPQVRLESRRHPFLTTLRRRLYINNHKVIDPHMLKLLDAEALAIIFMCDGGTYLERSGNTASISLHTKAFSYADNMALSKAIYNATGIRSTVNRHYDYYLLRINSRDNVLFYKTVLPYMKDSFLYKFTRIAPALQGDDIVCTAVEAAEASGDD